MAKLQNNSNEGRGQAPAIFHCILHCEKVFEKNDDKNMSYLDVEIEEAHIMTTHYATHHRHSCIGARAGFGDLLIGAGAMMAEANGLDVEKKGHMREKMVDLIKITEGFYACGIAASTMGVHDEAGNFRPDQIYSNIGKLLLANQIYDIMKIVKCAWWLHYLLQIFITVSMLQVSAALASLFFSLEHQGLFKKPNIGFQ